MSEPRSPIRAVLASFLFTDLVGFSKGTVSDQYAAKAALLNTLRGNLAALPESDYRVKDTGDGALIVFLSSPEHALYMALALAADFERTAAAATFPSNRLRTGINVGTVKETVDLEARPNYIGDGINDCKRIMDLADPGQTTASRSFFDAIAPLDAEYAAMFTHLGAPGDKHGRLHDMYALKPDLGVLDKLRADLGSTGSNDARGAIDVTPVRDRRAPRADAATRGSTLRTDTGVGAGRRWLLAGIGLLVFAAFGIVGVKWMTPAGPARGVGDAGIAEQAKEPAARVSMPVNPPTELAAPVRAGASPPPSDSVQKEVVVPEAAAAPATSNPERLPADAASVSARSTRPQAARADNAATAPAAAIISRSAAKPKAPTPSVVAAPPTEPRMSLRCNRIIEKSALGEPLSDEQRQELERSCR